MFKRLRKKNNDSESQYAYDSMQIWYESVSGQESNRSDIDIDVNVCKLRMRKSQNTYLDFGFKIKNPGNVKRMFVYLPWKLQKDDVKDLGIKFREDRLLNGVFNEDYARTLATKKYFVWKDKKHVFTIQILSGEEDISVEIRFSGTLISLKVDDPIKDEDSYIRIRVICPEVSKNGRNGFFRLYRPKFFFFDNAFSMLDTTDFRINERRSIQNSDLMQDIEKKVRFSVKEVKYFLIVPFDDELLESSHLRYQRQLEGGGFWNYYLDMDSNYHLGEMCVYNFNDKPESGENELSHFRIFHKIQYRKINLVSLLLYLIVMIALVTLSDFVSEGIRSDWVPGFWEWLRTLF